MLIRTTGGDESGFAVAAGRSKDQSPRPNTHQQLSNRAEIPAPARQLGHVASGAPHAAIFHDNGGYDATINLPAPGKYQVKRYRISDSCKLRAGGSKHIEIRPEHPLAGRAAAAGSRTDRHQRELNSKVGFKPEAQ